MNRRALVLCLVAVAGCDRSQTLTSPDGALEITVPGKWTKDSLNKAAVIQADNKADELYVLVLSEPKGPLKGMKLDRFSEITRGAQLATMAGGSAEGGIKRNINGMPALEYVLKGTVDKANVVMKHVSFDGTDRFHQVLVWTISSKWDTEKDKLDKVVESFRETK